MVNYPKYNTLSADEEHKLALRSNKGDKSARDLLILSNIRFVIYYAKKFSSYSYLEEDDLIQEGVAGMVYAANKFNAERRPEEALKEPLPTTFQISVPMKILAKKNIFPLPAKILLLILRTIILTVKFANAFRKQLPLLTKKKPTLFPAIMVCAMEKQKVFQKSGKAMTSQNPAFIRLKNPH